MSLLPNVVTLAAVPEPGNYVSLVKLGFLLVLPLPWLWAVTWVDKDVQRILSPRLLWTPMVFLSGLAALLVWLFVPLYVAGLGVFVVVAATTIAIYVVHHNGRVIPEARVLTQAHLAKVFSGGKKRDAKLISKIKVYDVQGRPVPIPAEGTLEEKLSYNKAQELLYDIIWRRASEVDIAPANEAAAVRYVIDGVVVARPHLDRAEAETVIDYIKPLAGMDVADKRRPQTGRMAVDLANHPINVTLVVAGSTAGQRMQMRIVQEAVRTDIQLLGLAADTLEKLRRLNALPSGLIVASARPRNGLTSTLYSLLRDNDAYIKQLVSVEQHPEVDLENITQMPYKAAADMPHVLAGVLRRDPDVVMVDRAEDAAGASAVLEAAEDKKILLGLTARDSFTALALWAQTAGDARAAVGPLEAVLSQVLVRKLCPNCKEAYRPDPEMLRKANLPEKLERFYRPPTRPLTDEKGNPITCPTCQGSGYLGRTAAFELLELTDELRKPSPAGPTSRRSRPPPARTRCSTSRRRPCGWSSTGSPASRKSSASPAPKSKGNPPCC